MDAAVEDYGALKDWSPAQVRKAKRICYRTVFTESDWWNYANPSVEGSIEILPNDGYPPKGGDLDSVGLYQQRARWWGTTEGSMNPYVATGRFLATMVGNTPGWFVTDESTVCQNTQGSQFNGVKINPATGKPYPFAQNYKDRQVQTDAMDLDLLYYTNGGK